MSLGHVIIAATTVALVCLVVEANLPCDPGYELQQNGQCVPCATGHFFDGSTCQVCIAGFVNNKTACVGARCCQPCEKGYFARSSGQSNCDPCPPGTYQDSGGQSRCVKCGVDTYNSNTASVDAGDCRQCPLSATSPEMSTTITNCSCSSLGIDSSTLFVSSPTEGVCACIPGYYLTHLRLCRLCSGATYKDAVLGSCKQCPIADSGLEQTPSVKPANSVHACQCGGSSTGSTIYNDNGNEKCTCAPGYNRVGTQCRTCSTSEYKSVPGTASCTWCPGGMTTATRGATRIEECKCRDPHSFEGIYNLRPTCYCEKGYRILPETGGLDGDRPAGYIRPIQCEACGSTQYMPEAQPITNDAPILCLSCPKDSSVPLSKQPGKALSDCICVQEHMIATIVNGDPQCACNKGYELSNSGVCVACNNTAYNDAPGGNCRQCPGGEWIQLSLRPGKSIFDCGCNGDGVIELSDGKCACVPGHRFHLDPVEGMECLPCAWNEYKAENDNICLPCPPYYHIPPNRRPGTSNKQCVPIPNAVAIDPSRPALGATCPGGYTIDPGTNASCIVCPADFYKTGLGVGPCTECPPLTTTLTGVGSIDANACECKANAVAGGTGTTCKCLPGHSYTVGAKREPGFGVRDNTQECIACNGTSWKSDLGNLPCTECPRYASIRANTLGTSKDDCICPPRSELRTVFGLEVCTCPPGFEVLMYQNELVECVPCPRTSYKESYSNSWCVACDGDLAVSNPPGVKVGDCTCAWKPNSLQNGSPPKCECQPGYEPSGDTCVACGPTQYKDTVANSPCLACPELMHVPTPPGVAKTDCVCVQGATDMVGLQKLTDKCTCKGGYEKRGVECIPCGPDHYRNILSTSLECEQCPPLSRLPEGRGQGVFDCVCSAHTQRDNHQCKCIPGYTPTQETNSTLVCTACPSNSFKSELGNGVCTPCPLGSFVNTTLGGGTSVEACECEVPHASQGNTTCVCDPGYTRNGDLLCVQCGANQWKATAGDHQCSPCPQYAQVPEPVRPGVGLDQCQCPENSKLVGPTGTERCECNPGYTLSSHGHCLPCRPGFYKPVQGNGACMPCPLMSTTNATSTIPDSIDACVCVGGAVRPSGSNADPCTCGPGYFLANSNDTHCHPCPANTYNVQIGSTDIGACVPCPYGSVSLPASANSTSCSCPPHTQLERVYLPVYNDTSKEIVMVSTPDCVCSPGYTYNNYTRSCRECDATHYKDTVGNQACSPCPSNTVVPSELIPGDDEFDCRCTHLPNKVRLQGGDCACVPGYEPSNSASKTCVPCGPSTYKDVAENSACRRCPFNTAVPEIRRPGAKESDCGCDHIPFSQLVPGQGCLCVPGYSFNPESNQCLACGEDTYKTSVSNSGCTRCPALAIVTAPPGTSLKDCKCRANAQIQDGVCQCDPGYGWSEASQSCLECPDKEFKAVIGNSGCQRCPLRARVPKDLQPATSSSQCECPSSSELVDGICVCSAGYTFSSDVDACVKCPANQYKTDTSNLACEACPKFSLVPAARNATTVDSCECQVPTVRAAASDGSAWRCECGPGYAYDPDTDSCTPCPASTYKDSIGLTSCVACPTNAAVPESAVPGTDVRACECPRYSILVGTSCMCLPGYTWDTRLLVCAPCPASMYKESISNSPCVPCPLGALVNTSQVGGPGTAARQCKCGALMEMATVTTYPVPGVNQTQGGGGRGGGGIDSQICQCIPGHGRGSVADPCVHCSLNHIKPNAGNTPCIRCPLHSRSSDSLQCECAPGFYPDPKDGQCRTCLAGAVCANGLLSADKGYWRASNTSLKLYECRPEHVCIDDHCAVGHSGLLCSNCLDGYTKSGTRSECIYCPRTRWWLVFLIYTPIVALILGYLYYSVGSGSHAKFTIILNYLQLLQLTVDRSSKLLTWLTLFEFDLFSFTRNLCVASLNYSSLWLLRLNTAVMLLGVLGLYYAVRRIHDWWTRRQARKKTDAQGERLDDDDEDNDGSASKANMKAAAKVKDTNHNAESPVVPMGVRVVRTVIAILIWTYMITTKNAVLMFACQEIGNVRTLTTDASFLCGTPQHRSYLAVSTVYLAVFAIGFPLVLWLLIVKKDKLPEFARSFDTGFLTDMFSPTAYWYILVFLLRRCAFVVLATLLELQPIWKTVTLTVLLFESYAVHVILKPFREKMDNIAESVCIQLLVVAMLLELVSSAFHNTSVANAVAIVLVVLNVMLGLVVLYLVVRYGRKRVRRLVRTSRFRQSKTTHSRGGSGWYRGSGVEWHPFDRASPVPQGCHSDSSSGEVIENVVSLEMADFGSSTNLFSAIDDLDHDLAMGGAETELACGDALVPAVVGRGTVQDDAVALTELDDVEDSRGGVPLHRQHSVVLSDPLLDTLAEPVVCPPRVSLDDIDTAGHGFIATENHDQVWNAFTDSMSSMSSDDEDSPVKVKDTWASAPKPLTVVATDGPPVEVTPTSHHARAPPNSSVRASVSQLFNKVLDQLRMPRRTPGTTETDGDSVTAVARPTVASRDTGNAASDGTLHDTPARTAAPVVTTAPLSAAPDASSPPAAPGPSHRRVATPVARQYANVVKEIATITTPNLRRTPPPGVEPQPEDGINQLRP